ncbi:glycosyltransferase family 32 protein [Enterocloster bolteae]|uniref:glycosyltransferase family 32 protein n=1 Tax=Enterocloster bolteae TaxID=208479 RepID=UPI00210AEBDC|nr:glycosyltransferase [Enterocloster bolteae]MCQ5140772.1 glycosyl transferase [Enterocloster bolteae]
MIPKKIHYCWFGGNPLPNTALKCIESWKKFFPDYEIIQWNEQNYDISKIRYIKEAYETKKYAFVSDYARFDVLYQYGGLYFDTDVEVIKAFDDILNTGAFMGCEIDGDKSDKNSILVNPGLGLAIEKGNPLYKEILDYYDTQSFFDFDGTVNTTTVVTRTTEILLQKGLKNINSIQKVEGITIYPKDYFNPRNNNTGKLKKTGDTHSVHWYSQSWVSQRERIKSRITRPFHRFFGDDCFDVLKRILERK